MEGSVKRTAWSAFRLRVWQVIVTVSLHLLCVDWKEMETLEAFMLQIKKYREGKR